MGELFLDAKRSAGVIRESEGGEYIGVGEQAGRGLGANDANVAAGVDVSMQE
jgi:hypothetical protein